MMAPTAAAQPSARRLGRNEKERAKGSDLQLDLARGLSRLLEDRDDLGVVEQLRAAASAVRREIQRRSVRTSGVTLRTADQHAPTGVLASQCGSSAQVWFVLDLRSQLSSSFRADVARRAPCFMLRVVGT